MVTAVTVMVVGMGTPGPTMTSAGVNRAPSGPVWSSVSMYTGNWQPSLTVRSTVTVTVSPTATCVWDGVTWTVAEKMGVVVGVTAGVDEQGSGMTMPDWGGRGVRVGQGNGVMVA